ncbi:hypothetical protein BV898_10242 [Hypsibius exemplaris]|uniref:Uncharacterized protein n=1 Tax=Hypsibius exemplaris TaxID=2072580 RepID=A0A1W0WKC2_HYPEX|nr:hypothetical protein BV898_10242 [Hypsibius exemplaris]
MFKSITLLHVSVLIVASVAATLDHCSIIISELQLTAPKVPQEFIELKASEACDLPLDLSPYSLVLWSANKSTIILKNQARFSGSNCSQLTKRYLVIGTDSLGSSPDGQFCSFSDFAKDWPKGLNAFIDKGNDKTNALVLYRDIQHGLYNVHPDTFLTEETAQRDKILDWLFFAKNGKFGEAIRALLIPLYNVGPAGHTAENVYFRLKEDDGAAATSQNKSSFGFCCEHTRVAGQWPLGFKYSRPTPGEANNCHPTDRYALDSVHGTYKPAWDRCDVQFITHVFDKEGVNIEITGMVKRDVVNSGESLKIGLGVGLFMLGAAVLLAGAVLFDRQRRQRSSSQETIVSTSEQSVLDMTGN